MNRTIRTAILIFGATSAISATKASAQMKVNYGDAPVAAKPIAALRMNQVDKLPEYKGDLIGFMSQNLEYPDSAREARMEGTTTLEFTVTATGLIQNLRVGQSSGFELLDNEALRLFNPMQSAPRWSPGSLNGRAVPVLYSLPITFKL